MPTYKLRAIVTLSVEMDFTIEAENSNQAIQKFDSDCGNDIPPHIRNACMSKLQKDGKLEISVVEIGLN
jgi:hypothetical protein